MAEEQYPEWVEAACRGHAARGAGDLYRAIEGYSESLALNPDDAEIWFYRAMTYYDLRDFDAAIADFDEVVRRAPTWESGFIKRGYACLAKDDYDRAIADFNESIQLSPTLGPLYRNRGEAYLAKGEDALAEADFREAKRLDSL